MLKSHAEEDITKMMDASAFGSMPPLSHALQLERTYLLDLGERLGRCAEKLVSLALQDSRRVAKQVLLGSSLERIDLAYFISTLRPALEHTEIEAKGCPFTDIEGSKAMARSLSQELKELELTGFS